MKNDLTVQTLHAAVDFIVKESAVDVCKMCTYYQEEIQAMRFDRGEDPCVKHSKHGDLACREGVIEKFQIRLTEGGVK